MMKPDGGINWRKEASIFDVILAAQAQRTARTNSTARSSIVSLANLSRRLKIQSNSRGLLKSWKRPTC
jgi:hypothetical protein